MSLREFVLPVEWIEHFEDGDDPDTVSFGEDALSVFLDRLEANGERLVFRNIIGTSRRTMVHDTPHYQDDDLLCYTYVFETEGGNNSPYRSKRKVNIGNTKAPLPKDITT